MKTNLSIKSEVNSSPVFILGQKKSASNSTKSLFGESSEFTPIDFKSLLNQESNESDLDLSLENNEASFEDFFASGMPFLPNLSQGNSSEFNLGVKNSTENSEIFNAIFGSQGALGVDFGNISLEKLSETISQQSNIKLNQDSGLKIEQELSPEIKNLLKIIKSQSNAESENTENINKDMNGNSLSESKDTEKLTYKIHKNADLLGGKKLSEIENIKINSDSVQISAKVGGEQEQDTNIKILKNTIHQNQKEGKAVAEQNLFGQNSDSGEQNLSGEGKSFLENALEKNLEKTISQMSSKEVKTESFVSNLSQASKGEGLAEENPQLVRIREFAAKAFKIANKTQQGTTSTARLLLRPESMGTVLVQVTVGNDAAKLKIETSTKEAAKQLEGQIAVLKNKFNQNGLKMESCDINFRQSEESLGDDSLMDNSQNQSKNQKSDRKIMQDFMKTLKSLSGFRDVTDGEVIST
jgi:flagellar hook-length control protein FliK